MNSLNQEEKQFKDIKRLLFSDATDTKTTITTTTGENTNKMFNNLFKTTAVYTEQLHSTIYGKQLLSWFTQRACKLVTKALQTLRTQIRDTVNRIGGQRTTNQPPWRTTNMTKTGKKEGIWLISAYQYLQKFLMTALHVICGLPSPPNLKSWLSVWSTTYCKLINAVPWHSYKEIRLKKNIHKSRQSCREGKRCFYDDPDRMIWVQSAPWSRCCVLG